MTTTASRLLSWSKCLLAVPVLLLSGCGSSWSAFNSSISLQGRVYGGNQPISNSSVQVYAAGREGIGSSAQALLKEPVRTDVNGNFSLTGLHVCPSSSSKIYLVAQGGNPGLSSGTNNPAISLMAMLGSCQDLAASTFVTVNEVTTVGSVSPVSSYMASVSKLGAPVADATFPQAISLVSQLVDTSRGVSPGKILTTNASVPASKVNTLANVLAACVNTSGGAAGDGSACGALFTLATPPGGIAPTDTAAAAMRIAQHPLANVAQLYALAQPSTAPFKPALAVMPSDWSLALIAAQSSPISTNGTTDIGSTTTGNAPSSTNSTTVAAMASNSTSIETLGTIPATQPLHGLGFNLNPTNDWELKMAAAAGATHARMQCGWNSTETQTAPPYNANTSTQFVLPAGCVSGLASARAYGIHPTVLAAFGPPYHAILKVTMPSGAVAGAKSIRVQFASGIGGDTLASIKGFYDNILSASNGYITGKHSYAGGLITGVSLIDSTHATLTLASAITSTLPANTAAQYIINEGLYAPAATSGAKDPSVLAYAKYAQFLASQIAASGNTGEVELWNEPPWGNDPWDNRSMFYDAFTGAVSPGPQQASLPNFGFAAALQAQKPPAGVTFLWGGTNKSGANSLLMSRMYANTGVYASRQPTVISAEAFHPYGNSPEDTLWTSNCLASTIKAYPTVPTSFSACNLAGTPGGNLSQAVQQSLVQQSINTTYGIGHSLTETGISNGDDAHKARFVLRQFLGYQAVGITPVEFFKLYDSASGYSFVSPVANADGSHNPLPALTALTGLMSDLAVIGKAPVTAIAATAVPTVSSYNGTYPLSTVQIVGSRAGDSANSIIMAVWQRSNVNGTTWATLPQPDAAPVTVQVPAGMALVAARNLATRVTVPYTQSGQAVTFQVSDDPIELLVEPSTQKLLTITVSPVSILAGTVNTTMTAKIVYTGANPPSGAVTFTLNTGASVQGTCTGSSSPLACTAKFNTASLPAGVHPATVTVAGDTVAHTNSTATNLVTRNAVVAASTPDTYASTSGSGTLTVVAAHLSFSTQPANAMKGSAFTSVVQVLDGSGNLVPNTGAITVSLANNPGSAALTGTTIVTPTNGTATFAGLSLGAIGNGYTLTASSDNVTGVNSASFNVTASTLFISVANIGFGASATGTINLPAPAPANVAISLSSNHTNYVSVPSAVTIMKGQSSAPFTYTGKGTGIATLTASADGYATYTRGLAGMPTAPVFTPAAGAYATGQMITLASTTPGVAIHYTVDGSAPSANSPVYNGALTFNAAETLKALSTVNGLTSPVSSAAYTVSAVATHIVFDVQPASSTAGATMMPAPTMRIVDASGKTVTSPASITVSFGANPGSANLTGTTTLTAVNGVATASALSVSAPGVGYSLRATSSTGSMAASSASFDVLMPGLFLSIANVGVGVTATGTLSLPSPATSAITVSLSSNHPNYVSVIPSVNIAKGQSSASFTYTGAGIGVASLTASAPGYAPFSRGLGGMPATPMIVPAAGMYAAGQQLTLSSSTSGAIIHYTLDGTAPTSTSAVYSAPLMLNSAMTVRAMAFGGGQSSSVLSAAYTLAVAAHLVFTTQPSNVTVGAALSPVVQVVDTNGSVISSNAPVTVVFGTNPSNASISGTTTVNAVNGVASFANLSVSAAGSGFTLSVSSPGMASLVSSPFTVTDATSTTTIPPTTPNSSKPGYYVSNSGNDSNAGTSPDAPWKTLAKLNAASMKAGGAAYLQCGSTFREGLTISWMGTADAPLTYGSYGNCTGKNLPILTGANLLSGWTSETVGSFTAYYASEATKPTVVFEDNHRLPIVAAKTSLTIGSSWIDTTNHRVYVRSRENADPSIHVVEASVRPYVVGATARNHFRINGLEIDKGAGTAASAVFTGNLTDIQITNSIFNYSYSNGLWFSANGGEYQSNILISYTTANFNGQSGMMKGNGGDNFIMDHDTCNYNGFDPQFVFSGGCHIVSDGLSDANRVTNSGIQYSTGSFNGVNPDTGVKVHSSTQSGVGIWCDTCGANSFLLHNVAQGNVQAGIQMEFSGTVGSRTMAYNVAYGNFYGVLHTRRSHNDIVSNNTTWNNYNNCQFSGEYNGGETKVGMVNNTYENNICGSQVSNPNGAVVVIEWGTENNSKGEGSGNVFKNNSFGLPTATNGVFAIYGANSKKTSYTALDAAYGSSMNSMTLDPMISNPSTGDFSLKSESPAIGDGIGGVDLGAISSKP